MFEKDKATRGRAETFIDVESNAPSGYKGFPPHDGNDMAIHTMYNQGFNMSHEDVRTPQPSRASDYRMESSESKRKQGGQHMETIDFMMR